jgi:Leucine-rich repeat (LRR) protein
LNVSFNNLESTTGLKDLNLRELLLNHNQIKHITEDFKTLSRLTILKINRNFIESIENLAKCEKLRILDISTNRLKSFIEIDYLQELVYLSEIDLC